VDPETLADVGEAVAEGADRVSRPPPTPHLSKRLDSEEDDE
jgi:hypothetical protein